MVGVDNGRHPRDRSHLSLSGSQTIPELTPSRNPESRTRLSLCSCSRIIIEYRDCSLH